MQRQKTSEELEQERRDEEFARQLQAEMMAENNPPPPQPQPQRQATYSPSQQFSPAPGVPPPLSGGGSNTPSSSSSSSSRITCQYCRSTNNVPVNAGTNQFLCGYCKRLLGFNQGPAAIVQQQQLAHYANNTNNNAAHHQTAPMVNPSQPIFQGNVQPPATVQVRCGQCSVVNAVPRPASGGTTLQFMCGSCQSVNEVSM